ncbi:MAG: (2Fe-2S)-binding protein [Thermoanaerobacteraceae bacterium]|nr:(2Fe-2S)-binding protein [Thermoanaerobacteraceae bacterium]
MEEKTVVCRCEDITVEEIEELIDLGYDEIEEIKRITRCSMGPCQGRTCRNLLIQVVASKTGKKIDELHIPTYRPPAKNIKMTALAGGDEDEK